MDRRFVIFDPGLSRIGGHNYTLASAFSEGAIQAGFTVIWLCHKEFPHKTTDDTIHIRRVFTHSYYAHLGIPKWRQLLIRHSGTLEGTIKEFFSPSSSLPLGKIKRATAGSQPKIKSTLIPFYSEALEAFRALELNAHDHVLITTAEYLQYKAILLLIQTLKPAHLPFIHLRTSYDETFKWNRIYGQQLPRVFKTLAGTGLVGTRLFFYAETDLLKDHFNKWNIVPFHTLENPVSLDAIRLQKRLDSNDPKFSLTVLFPGEARSEKGFHRIPAIIQKTIHLATNEKNSIKFIVQATRRPKKRKDNLYTNTLDKLHQFPFDLVKIIDHKVNNDEYYELIAKSDIVLLPYDQQRYKNRSSMILIESIVFGKPVVLSRGTSLETMVKHEAILSAETDEELAARIVTIMKNYDYFERSLSNYRFIMANRFNPETMIKYLQDMTFCKSPFTER